MEEYSYNLSEIPLSALGYKSRDLLSRQLDKHKVLPSSEGLPRDYRGLADLAGVACTDIRTPTTGVIALWSQVKQAPTFQDLINNLVRLDRWDVIDDLKPLLNVDAVNYSLKQKQVCTVNVTTDENIVTYDDADLVRIGLPPGQRYDAYLLYAEQDEEIALTIINKLENGYKLKLCVKDRDIIPGAGFEHEAITYLITERCNKLIAVLTPNFLNCPAQCFIYGYALADSIRERLNKIIPCVFQVSDDQKITNKIFKIIYSKVPINFTRKNPWGNWDILCRTISPETWDSNRGSKQEIQLPTTIKAIEYSKSNVEDLQLKNTTTISEPVYVENSEEEPSSSSIQNDKSKKSPIEKMFKKCKNACKGVKKKLKTKERKKTKTPVAAS